VHAFEGIELKADFAVKNRMTCRFIFFVGLGVVLTEKQEARKLKSARYSSGAVIYRGI
jgi:hypothetical protein